MTTSAGTARKWPELPYRGISFYGPEDAPLFAGREDDVRRIAHLLAEPSKRLILLHGYTGCGKSSFLRAGLIPFLEGEPGFQFLKDRENRLRAVFVRSTDKPLVELAKSVYSFAKGDVVVRTPGGDRTLGLTDVVGQMEEREFIDAVGRDPSRFAEALAAIAGKLSRTLVLIVDQAEEVVTLKPGKEGEAFRAQFFEFLALMTRMQLDMKLLIALRSEYYAQFEAELRQANAHPTGFEQAWLKNLEVEQMTHAIKRPTQREPIEGYGVPYEHYHFSFEPDLPERIARDIGSRKLAGGSLPVLQVVCGRLYANTRPKDPNAEWTITFHDYRQLGGIEQQMEENLNDELEALCRSNGIQAEARIVAEMIRWKDVLVHLAQAQPDGTVTSAVKSSAELEHEVRQARCELTFDQVKAHLTRDEVRVLRREDLVHLETQTVVECYGLGHDAIGLVLHRWAVARREMEASDESKLELKQARELLAREVDNWRRSQFLMPGDRLTIVLKHLAALDPDVDAQELVFRSAMRADVAPARWLRHVTDPSVRERLLVEFAADRSASRRPILMELAKTRSARAREVLYRIAAADGERSTRWLAATQLARIAPESVHQLLAEYRESKRTVGLEALAPFWAAGIRVPGISAIDEAATAAIAGLVTRRGPIVQLGLLGAIGGAGAGVIGAMIASLVTGAFTRLWIAFFQNPFGWWSPEFEPVRRRLGQLMVGIWALLTRFPGEGELRVLYIALGVYVVMMVALWLARRRSAVFRGLWFLIGLPVLIVLGVLRLAWVLVLALFYWLPARGIPHLWRYPALRVALFLALGLALFGWGPIGIGVIGAVTGALAGGLLGVSEEVRLAPTVNLNRFAACLIVAVPCAIVAAAATAGEAMAALLQGRQVSPASVAILPLVVFLEGILVGVTIVALTGPLPNGFVPTRIWRAVCWLVDRPRLASRLQTRIVLSPVGIFVPLIGVSLLLSVGASVGLTIQATCTGFGIALLLALGLRVPARRRQEVVDTVRHAWQKVKLATN